MTRTEMIQWYALMYSTKDGPRSRDPIECVKHATYFVDRVLDLTKEKEPETPIPPAANGKQKMPILKRPKH